MSETPTDREDRIRQAAERLFIEAKHVGELTRARVLQLAGEKGGQGAFDRVFPGEEFELLRQSWLLQRIENAMAAAFDAAENQRQISMQRVADLAGCGLVTVRKLAGPQFLARKQALPKPRQLIVQAIDRLVGARIPPQEYSWARVYAEAGLRPGSIRFNKDITRAFGNGLETLTRYHEQQQQQPVPNATNALIQGYWINVDESAWYLPPQKRTIRRDQLRPDIAAVAWPLLREEALTTSPSASTLIGHHQSCLFLARLLGHVIPDIRAITLATLQRVWLCSEASIQVRRRLRPMLIRILEALIAQSGADTAPHVVEYASVIQWLRMIPLGDPALDKNFLSEKEFDELIDRCLQDILQGFAYIQHSGSADGQVLFDIQTYHAEPVLHWGVGLIVLVMTFTGLRRQSVAQLTIEDIAQIGPQVFALSWQHGKPNKQLIAVISALVAEYLQHYIRTTEPIRARLGTRQVFLARNHLQRWDLMTDSRLGRACKLFASRHTLTHNGAPFSPGSTLLRRTYATRALYELPNVAAIQAQLGHGSAYTTLGYVQHDRFEHPDQVDSALDAFGRKVLARWHKPLLLNDLPDAERQALLTTRVVHEQDVGMCRHNCCVKLDEAHLPPCSLCEHLVSGPEYLAAWEHEKALREQQLKRLARTPGAELILAQMKGLYDRFLANYQFIQERSRM